jgi:hypothetical protein
MPLVRWKFEDTETADEYTFEVNPSEGGSKQYDKRMTFQTTTASDGKTLVFEGQPEIKTLSFSGTILTQAQYDQMIFWFQKKNPILITDDLGRETLIYIKTFRPERQRAIHYPWKHSYSVEAIVLE